MERSKLVRNNLCDLYPGLKRELIPVKNIFQEADDSEITEVVNENNNNQLHTVTGVKRKRPKKRINKQELNERILVWQANLKQGLPEFTNYQTAAKDIALHCYTSITHSDYAWTCVVVSIFYPTLLQKSVYTSVTRFTYSYITACKE
jgi:hypothetical protein